MSGQAGPRSGCVCNTPAKSQPYRVARLIYSARIVSRTGSSVGPGEKLRKFAQGTHVVVSTLRLALSVSTACLPIGVIIPSRLQQTATPSRRCQGHPSAHSLIAFPPAASKLPVLFVVTHTLFAPYGFSPVGTREQRDRQGTVMLDLR